MDGKAFRDPSDYRILVVDDEKKLCELLVSALKTKYNVQGLYTATDALGALAENAFDVVVTDLKLPDKSGLDILDFAKKKDTQIEVIIITGYASLDSAVKAVNLGAASYLVKPVSLANFAAQVDRAVAHRDFILKSQALMKEASGMGGYAKEHLANITEIYEFSRKLVTTLDVPEVMRTILTEINRQVKPIMTAVGVSMFGASDIFAMPGKGKADTDSLRTMILDHWEKAFPVLSREHFQEKKIKVTVFDGDNGQEKSGETARCTHTIPMMISGKVIGSIAVYNNTEADLSVAQQQLLHIVTSMAAPLVENSYIHRRTQMLAETDALTGIGNHRSFQEMLSREIARASRHDGMFALMMIDIDDFKKINDTFGHLVGDAVLRDLTGKVLQTIRQQDIVSRYGGEEFAVILPDTNIKGAAVLADRVRAEIANHPYVFPGNEIPYTVSIGVSAFARTNCLTKEQLIKEADDALYVSKNEGKNRVTAR
jgi:diguanylate cyclase (GGDEF)-like protein